MDAVVRWNLKVFGQVQGVGYRDLVTDVATEMGLSGSVWNDPEDLGLVHVVVQGPREELDRFVRRIRAHHGLIRPTSVERTQEDQADPLLKGFFRG